MPVSIFLARLLGPLLLLPGIGLLVNPRAFRAMATEVVGSVTLVYLFGLLDFAAGLAIVLVHNMWTVNWRVLITLIGWLFLIRGAARILITDTLIGYAKALIGNKRLYPVSGGVLVILGQHEQGGACRSGSEHEDPAAATTCTKLFVPVSRVRPRSASTRR
jgi:hypothetical protein